MGLRSRLAPLVGSALLLGLPTVGHGGTDGYNHDVGVHHGPTSGPEYWASIHCEPTYQGSPCGGSTVYVRSVGVNRQIFLGIKAAAAGSVCTTVGVVGSAFDAEAGAAWPALWSHSKMTPARKAALCALVDEWM